MENEPLFKHKKGKVAKEKIKADEWVFDHWSKKIFLIFGLIAFVLLLNQFFDGIGLVIGLLIFIYLITRKSRWVLTSWWEKAIYLIGLVTLLIYVLMIVAAFMRGFFKGAQLF